MSYDELMVVWYGLLFGIMGILGVVIESLAASVKSGRWVYRGNKYWRGLPFIPMYAVGGVVMYLIMKKMIERSAVDTILVASLAMSIWEYVGGEFCVRVLKKRLWSYNKHWGNLGGHVSFLSTSWWLVLAIAFYFLALRGVMDWEMNWRRF